MTAISGQLRAIVEQRARQRCEYCRLPQALQVATFPVDHVIPRSRGGVTELDNLALACPRCNAAKWTHTQAADPETGQVVQLFHPRQHRWDEHFQWSAEDPAMVEAVSPSGRATLALLELNSPQHVAIRKWLITIGEHPTD